MDHMINKRRQSSADHMINTKGPELLRWRSSGPFCYVVFLPEDREGCRVLNAPEDRECCLIQYETADLQINRFSAVCAGPELDGIHSGYIKIGVCAAAGTDFPGLADHVTLLVTDFDPGAAG